MTRSSKPDENTAHESKPAGISDAHVIADPEAFASTNVSVLFEEQIVHPLVARNDDDHSVAYVWNLQTDQLGWESDAELLLGVWSAEKISTGKRFEAIVAPDYQACRRSAFDADVTEDLGNGVPYRLQFRLEPKGSQSRTALWIEESGRWWADSDGRPAHARGVMTIRNTAFHEATDALLADDADELTGQLSRVRFMEALDGMIAHVDATGRSCGLLIASIDNMALINEAFGFEIGDRVIAATGAILKTDMRSGDAIGRYSGNKFGIIVNDCDPEELQNVANRLIRAVREANGQRGLCPLSATLSIGGVLVPDVARTAHKALCGALQALEGAKVERHERFRPFETDPGRAAARRRNVSVAAEVVSALDEDRMRLALQPVVDSRTGEPVFYEALMRMEQPDGTVVSAGDFVEIVERLGFSRLIDLRTLTLAVDILRENPDLKLALNVSALTCGEQDWIRQLRALTADAPELCRRLIVEITETAAIEDLDQSIVFVDTLKELGCMVALDDFGSGYTSFTTLKHLSVDIIKIDGAFVKDLDHDGKDAVFLKMMVSLADSLGMKSVAEWVGSEATARIVAAAGVTYMQGFHYGEAQTPQALSKAGLCGAGQ